MVWSCIPSKKSVSQLVASPVEPVVLVEPVVSEVAVKKCCSCNCAPCAPVRCAPCAPVRCAPCAPLSCLPLRCCKPSQPLVLRSTLPAETDKLTGVAKVSAPDAEPAQVSAKEPAAPVVHESQI